MSIASAFIGLLCSFPFGNLGLFPYLATNILLLDTNNRVFYLKT